MILDKEQKVAVETNKKRVLVASCPGSGKTRVLTERLKYLLNNSISLDKIFAITYTNAAAQEMRNRVNNSEVFIGTIHSLANRILLLNGIDTSSFISEENFDELFEETKRKINEIRIPEIDHLLVDEFQDIGKSEYEFITNILKPKNFFYCGDSCQSIFSFKGSNYKYFMRILNDPFTTVYELKNNYRCGEEIINFADLFIENINDIYKVDSVCKSGKIGEVEKIRFNLDYLLDSLDSGKYRDWFILCRTNDQVKEICDLLEKNNIWYTTFKQSDFSLEELNHVINANMVKVLTIHSAKGLESKNVAVIGASTRNPEEKRICYVAATRAKEKLLWITGKPVKKKTNYNMQNWE